MNKNASVPSVVFVLFVLFISMALRSFGAADEKLLLWFQQPATQPMNEALAIGNGRMGALVFGAPAKERLCLNESSLWTGDENPDGNYDSMGAYQVLGNVFINLPGHESAYPYRRELDLGQALTHVHYECNGVPFEREFFCSHPAGVLAARFTAAQRPPREHVAGAARGSGQQRFDAANQRYGGCVPRPRSLRGDDHHYIAFLQVGNRSSRQARQKLLEIGSAATGTT